MRLEIIGHKENIGGYRRLYRIRCDEEAADRLRFLVNERHNQRMSGEQLREEVRSMGFPREWDPLTDFFYITYVPTSKVKVGPSGGLVHAAE